MNRPHRHNFARWIREVSHVMFAVLSFAGVAGSLRAETGVLWEPGQGEKTVVDHATIDVEQQPDGKTVANLVAKDLAESVSVRFRPEDGMWDLSASQYVGVQLQNRLGKEIRVQWRARAKGKSLSRNYVMKPNESILLRLTLRRSVPPQFKDVFFGMRGYPALMDPERGIDVSAVEELALNIRGPVEGIFMSLGPIKTLGSFPQPEWWHGDTNRLFPMIDTFGQYRHADWPGKTHSLDELRGRISEEDRDLEQHLGPTGWNQFGGWDHGPKLQAKGHFSVTKYGERWWLVDPEGCLFWSHGIDCVRATTATTPITNREHWFELPSRDGPFGIFYSRANWAPRGYYQTHSPYDQLCFSGVNLLRKYGEQWESVFADRVHRRLRSWGLNTIGNWSDPAIYRLRRTPYVVTLSSGKRTIEGSTGYWKKFPDPFDPEFDRPIVEAMKQEADQSAGDPWCLGYFVDNELGWGDELSLALATILSPSNQPAKKAFLQALQQKYSTIEDLNQVWGTKYQNWDAFLASTEEPDRKKAEKDLAEFYTQIAETYFRRCREAVKGVAPDKLYLGCRFAWVNDRAIQAAAKFCDIVSFNRYDVDVAGFTLPAGLDKPVIIGEFHFGALDRGMFHTGLQETADQEERAEAYRRYVGSALNHPLIVGTHWFQLMDQATTGRGDGENYQIGFLDVCDTPYPEIIQASRDVAGRMYVQRLKGQ
ncbi:MAG: beta-galactosidase [Thermogutta sp.]